VGGQTSIAGGEQEAPNQEVPEWISSIVLLHNGKELPNGKGGERNTHVLSEAMRLSAPNSR